MASYSSGSTQEPGQYPTTAWSMMGLPEQSHGTGAPGTGQGGTDAGARGSMAFSGTQLGGTGAPGSGGAGISRSGPDSVTVSRPTFYKGQDEPGGLTQGATTYTVTDTVSGPGDWTQANDEGYAAASRFQMPGTRGNVPVPNSGPFQPAGGSVMYGGRLNGTQSTSSHPSHSGPGT